MKIEDKLRALLEERQALLEELGDDTRTDDFSPDQERDESGKWAAGGGGGGTKAPKEKVAHNSPEARFARLAEISKRVGHTFSDNDNRKGIPVKAASLAAGAAARQQLEDIDRTLGGKLGNEIRIAPAKAKVTINENSLGIPREQMPQFKGENAKKFLDEMRGKSVGVSSGTTRVADLKPTQLDLNETKAQSMLEKLPREALEKPIIVSRDGYILDGHHRWAALKLRGVDSTIQTHKVDLPIRELLDVANASELVSRRTINDRADAALVITPLLRVRALFADRRDGLLAIRNLTDMRAELVAARDLLQEALAVRQLARGDAQ